MGMVAYGAPAAEKSSKTETMEYKILNDNISGTGGSW
jgi:hypothetical protein